MNYPLPQPPYQGPPPAQPAAPPVQQYPPQYPQAPQQGYPVTPPAPQYPGYPVAPAQGYAPQQYAQQAPPAPVANATIADFYNQPSSGSGPSIGWKTKQGLDKPIGSWFAGHVSRDVTNGDIDQQTNTAGVPQTFRDGRPKLQMKVGLKGLTTSEGNGDHPDGEGTWYVKGLGRDELSRAMAEAGCPAGETPKAGAYVVVVLVGRRPNGAGYNPSNIVQVTYTPAAGSAPAAPAPAAVPAQQPEQYAAPVQAPAPPPAAPVAPPAAPAAPPQVQQSPVQPVAPAGPVAPAAPVQQQAPVQAPAQIPAPPTSLDPAAQAILAGLTAPAPAQG